MTVCPKCDCIRIMGPTYVQNVFGEALKYVCAQCGYTTFEPTAEQQRRNPAAPEVDVDA